MICKLHNATSHGPIRSLALVFICWKVFLFSVALISPGTGYDTSTDILLSARAGLPDDLGSSSIRHRLILRLLRWDAFYFVPIATTAYVHEQDWAFGWGWTSLISAAAKGIYGQEATLADHALAGIALANVSHLLSALVLYYIVQHMDADWRLSFTSAVLHILTPGGLFLCAPYAEATFSLLSFLGCLCYIKSEPSSATAGASENAFLIIAGALFGCSATVRSNGLFNGIPFLCDLLDAFMNFDVAPSIVAWLHRVACIAIGGFLVGFGFAVPQSIAYIEYCGNASAARPPWCDHLPPSIYTYVQSRYWGVGWFRYWSFGNLPLFLLASPMLMALLWTGISALVRSEQLNKSQNSADRLGKRTALRRLAIPQIALVFLALTQFHVQVITRISTAYPLLYYGMAHSFKWRSRWSKLIVSYAIIYALMQGGLYASFLPPA